MNRRRPIPRSAYWSLDEAIRFWLNAEHVLDNHGFLCGIYGSALHGRGRDLDLLIIPKRINTSIEFAADALAFAADGKLSEPYDGLMGTRSYILELRNGKFVDAQFYKSKDPRDAEDMYVNFHHDSPKTHPKK